MSNLNGWNLTGRLLAKHFGALGTTLASAIANFDPETATKADRDRLQGLLQQTAQKLASARIAFNKEQEEVKDLQALIETDEHAAAVLLQRLEQGTISEATVQTFCDELEANKARLPQEQQEAEDAKAFMGELQQIVDTLSQQLADFDANAKRVRQELAKAQAQQNLQALRISRQREIDSLKGLGGTSTALAALTRRAEQTRAQAEGLKIVADIQQKPLDRAAEVDAIRRSVQAGATASESTADRLRRLTAKPAAGAAA